MKTNIRIIVVAIVAVLTVGCRFFSYESAYEMTPVDKVEVKTLPGSRVLVTGSEGRYFDRANGLFMKLFRYIRDHDVAMTVPVEARMEKAQMLFHVGGKDTDKALESRDDVQVLEREPLLVASLGARGSYSEKNFLEAKERLDRWLSERDDFVRAGKPYAVFWNGPFVPGFLKRFEVHLPVKAVVLAMN
jgi:hypothetical protein